MSTILRSPFAAHNSSISIAASPDSLTFRPLQQLPGVRVGPESAWLRIAMRPSPKLPLTQIFAITRVHRRLLPDGRGVLVRHVYEGWKDDKQAAILSAELFEA
jgi:hypothetical protein